MNELNYASLEASKRLYDAGIVLETDAVWAQRIYLDPPDWVLISKDTYDSGYFRNELNNQYEYGIPAPSMAEVWRALPPGTGLRKAHSFTEAFNFTDTENADSIYPPCNSPDNPTDALIDLLIYIKRALLSGPAQ